MRTKTRKKVECIIHIQEINPWPPSPSLTTPLLIHWEHLHVDRHHNSSGFTNQVLPSLGRIEFNHSFKLLMREGEKNCIQFNLYQPRRDKVVLLATALLDLAAYGVVRENLSISAPIHCKRTYRNAVQPLVFLQIQPVETSLNRGESVSTLMSEEYAQEAEVASFTTNDDDASSQSLLVDRDTKTKPSSDDTVFSSPVSKLESITKLIHHTDKLFGSGFHDKSDDSLLNSRLNGLTDNGTNVKHERNVEEEGQKIDIDRSKNGKSVRSSTEASKSSGQTRSNHSDTARGSISSGRKDARAYRKETRSLLPEHLENRIKILEGELREAAAMEVSLYSVVAEHGSSMNKVHAPARRLSRLYFHANKKNPKSGRANAAKSVVSGLLIVAKACGSDVPRLTFWLSNAIVLRAITNKSFRLGLSPGSVGRENVKVGDRNGKKKLESFHSMSTRVGNAGDWENPLMFVTALEKIETWIFSRIIESLWWQSFTPHMQSGARLDSKCSKSYKRTSSSIEQQQGNFSLQLWEKAFRDACERICPVRAGGHECGCLPVLSRLIMEQLIARLDVAMFNGILRESADEIPMDPVADPISDAKVLPISAGKASFGAGAQLKNAIGNWSRWLTDQFGMDDDDGGDVLENEEQRSRDTSPKPFHLLNSLSDLMMLPKDTLLSPTIRKEVCPAFGALVIRRILNSFVPDEFCPDPIPAVVIEALNSEDRFDLEDDSIINLPCEAVPVVYKTPSAASVAGVLGEISNHSAMAKLKRSESCSLLNKSQTSDNELDELDSPLRAVMLAGWVSSNDSTVRYRLLREVWRMDE